MKTLKDNVKPLIIRPIEMGELNGSSVLDYDTNVKIVDVDDSLYMVLKRKFKNGDSRKVRAIYFEDATCIIKNGKDITEDNSRLSLEYGDKDSIIVDMHGIDNFRFAKNLVFEDKTVRKIIFNLELLDKNSNYLRIGSTGARESSFHPGGEVLECSEIRGRDLGGISQDISGYLPEGKEYSKAIELADEDGIHLREERIVYLHAAYLKKTPRSKNTNYIVEIEPKKDDVSLLDITSELAQKLDINAYAIQIVVENAKVNGRVLRHMPQRPFKVLQDATDIGLEQLFEVKNNAKFYGFGTYYNRYEPEWAEFTGGRKYERRGHIHATVVDNEEGNDIHEVFHLRDAFVSKDSKIKVVLTPIEDVYKIYPIYKKEGNYYIKVTDKNIDEIIEGTKNLY